MKRTASLFSQIVDYENLHLAWLKARKGKTCKKSVQNFSRNVNKNLQVIHDRMIASPPVLSKYIQFKIYDPKARMISVVPFPDRVMHHAIMNVLEPVFERQFIFHTYACRKGKGTHAAARYAFKCAGRSELFLKVPVFGKTFRGVPFLGWRITKDRIFLLSKTKRRMKNRLKEIQKSFERGKITEEKAVERTKAVFAARKLINAEYIKTTKA